MSLDNALLILGVIAMLEKALIDLAALASIAQFVLSLWRGRKTRPEDAKDKKERPVAGTADRLIK